MTPEEAAGRWGIKIRQVQTLCSNKRIAGARKLGRMWLIPKNAEKPTDNRIKATHSNVSSSK